MRNDGHACHCGGTCDACEADDLLEARCRDTGDCSGLETRYKALRQEEAALYDLLDHARHMKVARLEAIQQGAWVPGADFDEHEATVRRRLDKVIQRQHELLGGICSNDPDNSLCGRR